MDDFFGFQLLREQQIPEINTKARLFRHRKIGAALLSLENDDENKVFGITFRTPPSDSTGVAHIMEHSVLCGSRKYPVKEPFIELAKGSLNTFLNAMTYPDKTCYPVASQNVKDFYNLIDVYIDAVFYPLNTLQTLEQEGWHYELDSLDGPMTYKGVVYNEMKGNYSSPDDILARHSQQSLFPDNTYGVDSGGDPQVIPNLTYEQFRDFHRSYYHPSNARIFFYGDDDPAERLRYVNEYLKDFDPIEPHSSIALQPSFPEPRRVAVAYDSGEDAGDKKGMVTANWMLSEQTDPQTSLGLHILEHILVGTPASPLRKALIDSGLGEDLAGVGLDSDTRQMLFSIGMKGIAVEDADKVESLIAQTLTDLAGKGIDPDTVRASVNTIEFRLRENNTGAFPRGLSLMLRCLSTWLYDGDPLSPLAFEAPLSQIKEQLASGEPYFENLINQHLLKNGNRTTVILRPDPGVGKEQEAAEQRRLMKVRQSLSEQELQEIVEETRRLKLRQETPDSAEALQTIPSLKLEELDKQNKLIPLNVSEQHGDRILYHDLFTNGIVYLDVGFNLHSLPQEYIPYLSLFGRALLEIGTESQDFVKLSQRIGATTGGIRRTILTTSQRKTGQAVAWLFLRGKSTVPQMSDLVKIIKDILLTVKLDNCERFKQMVMEEKAGLEAGLVPGGHRVVNTRLRSLFNEADWITERISGISYLFFLRQLAQDVENNWAGVLEKLENIRHILINRSAAISNITLDQANYATVKHLLEELLASLPSRQEKQLEWLPDQHPGFEGLTIPAKVNFVGKGANLYALGYRLNGSVLVINKFLGTTWLWEKVRVQGGAYGGYALFDHRSGVYTLLSYRDPNLLGTIDAFDYAGQFLRSLDAARLSQEELTKSIIGTIGDLDAYQLPDAKGFTSLVRYLAGDTEEDRQILRDQVLNATLDDFHAFGEVLHKVNEAGKVVVLGSQEAIAQANAAYGARTGHPDWLDVIKVL
ncbi:MAG: insulinase family protein [Omnitrophica WOR_2 bacterium]